MLLHASLSGLSIPFELDCATRATSHRPFASSSSAPVQYIHVPKAGGTTIQVVLSNIARAQKMTVHTAGIGLYAKSSLPVGGALQNRTLYLGHERIGWGPRPSRMSFTLISWREPLSLMTSLYNYKASYSGDAAPSSHMKQVHHLRAAELQLASRGVAPGRMLDELLRRDDHVAWAFANFTAAQYLIPTTCSNEEEESRLAADNAHATDAPTDAPADMLAAIMLQNLAAIDIVVMSDRLDDQLAPQLKWHAPWLTARLSRSTRLPHQNTARREAQVLSEEVMTRVTSSAHYKMDCMLADFAARVAQARTQHATSCHEIPRVASSQNDFARNSSGEECSLRSCVIDVSPRELALLERDLVAQGHQSCVTKAL